MSEITLTVNGKPQQAPEGTSLLGLLAVLELNPRSVVVEHNREIVRRLELDQHAVHEGDQVELVHFVGGG